jgi:uncharacterized protein YeaO (DUF488 family)
MPGVCRFSSRHACEDVHRGRFSAHAIGATSCAGDTGAYGLVALHAGDAVSVRIVRLGSPRLPGEGTRIGTVRRPPRGVRREAYAARDYYDVWLPTLAPSPETVKLGLAATTPREWAAFEARYRREMARADASHALATLAALSHTGAFSVGCYCEDESRCHRRVLRELLRERRADIA